jgi:ATP-dependent DNA helicase RecG
MMVMSATPIPRTLALILYGDLDLSILDEAPQGRIPIKTYCVPPTKRIDMYRFIREQALAGKQAYVICPLVEDSESVEGRSVEEVFDELRRNITDVRVDFVHGRMPGMQKDTLIQRFERGETSVLVATTVVEVGMDVPNAAVMVIESPERFGLAQLHQLRGRIGRGKHESHCFVMLPEADQGVRNRLEYFKNHLDGFELAEEDLRLRGPGQFLGTRQTGLPDMKAAEFSANLEWVQKTKNVLDRLMEGVYGEEARAAVCVAALKRYRSVLMEITFN